MEPVPASFLEEIEVAVKHLVFLALNDLNVAGWVSGGGLEFHGFVDHQEFEEFGAGEDDGIFATFVKRFACEGDGAVDIGHGCVVVKQFGPIIIGEVDGVIRQTFYVHHELIWG